MTQRKLRDPNARLQHIANRAPEIQIKEIREVLVDMWALVSPFHASQDDSYTTTGKVAHEVVVMTNTVSATVTLHKLPADGDRVTVKRTDAQVTVDTEGTEKIDGQDEIILGAQYDAPQFIYTDAGGEWSII